MYSMRSKIGQDIVTSFIQHTVQSGGKLRTAVGRSTIYRACESFPRSKFHSYVAGFQL